MRQTSTLALILTATIGVAAAPAHPQQNRDIGGIGLSVWADSNYRGANHTFRDDNPDLRSIDLDDRISSLRAAPGEVWEVCTEPRYQGRCQVFSGNETNLTSRGWNDTISSVRRVRGGGGGGGGGFPGRPPTALELYAGLDFSGRRIELTGATSDFRRLEFSDRAMSLRVPRNQAWEVCANINFDDCRVVTDDVRDLNEIGLSRLLSSARPRSGRGGAGGGGRPRLVLYDQPGYAGRTLTIENERGTLSFFSNQAGSAQVVGRWELCDEPGFNGRCVTISSDVRDLARLGLRDRVSSVRPR